MRRMNGEQEAKEEQIGKSADLAFRSGLSEGSTEELAQSVGRLREQVELDEAQEPILEPVPASKEDLRALSDEVLQQQVEVLRERLKVAERAKELDQKALNLGLLKLANRAPRCTHLKSNGKPCRAPAMGNRLFCVFHGRALETQENPRIKVTVLEDRESLQLTVKQIMEQIVSGRIEPQHASLLLRAVQIANSTLKPNRVHLARRKPARSETGNGWGNPEENSG